MPRIGSILNTPLAAIDKAVADAENEKQNILRMMDNLTVDLKKQDEAIAGYRYAHKVLLEESNKI